MLMKKILRKQLEKMILNREQMKEVQKIVFDVKSKQTFKY